MAKGFGDLDTVAQQYNLGGKKGEWYQPEEGENYIRVVSGFEVLAKHWANGKMLAICIGKDKGCPICNLPEELDPATGKAKSHKPTVKFLMYIIDRADGKIKIAEFGWSIVEAMKNLSTSKEYGFPAGQLPPYDMILTKTVKNGGKNISDTSYTVVGARTNTPLTTDEENEIIGLTDIEEVVKRIKAKAGADEDAEAEEERGSEMEVEEVDISQLP